MIDAITGGKHCSTCAHQPPRILEFGVTDDSEQGLNKALASDGMALQNAIRLINGIFVVRDCQGFQYHQGSGVGYMRVRVGLRFCTLMKPSANPVDRIPPSVALESA